VCARVDNQQSRGVVTARVRTDVVRSLRHQRRWRLQNRWCRCASSNWFGRDAEGGSMEVVPSPIVEERVRGGKGGDGGRSVPFWSRRIHESRWGGGSGLGLQRGGGERGGLVQRAHGLRWPIGGRTRAWWRRCPVSAGRGRELDVDRWGPNYNNRRWRFRWIQIWNLNEFKLSSNLFKL
jgi:hypothetical protein